MSVSEEAQQLHQEILVGVAIGIMKMARAIVLFFQTMTSVTLKSRSNPKPG
jgi:hypothetical protein